MLSSYQGIFSSRYLVASRSGCTLLFYTTWRRTLLSSKHLELESTTDIHIKLQSSNNNSKRSFSNHCGRKWNGENLTGRWESGAVYDWLGLSATSITALLGVPSAGWAPAFYNRSSEDRMSRQPGGKGGSWGSSSRREVLACFNQMKVVAFSIYMNYYFHWGIKKM